MPLTGSRRMHALSGPRLPGFQSRRRSWRFRIAVLASLLVHLAVLVLLLVTIRREPQPELLPPPAAVTMLFDTGKSTGPTLPDPDAQVIPPSVPSDPVPLAPPVAQPPIEVPFPLSAPIPPAPEPQAPSSAALPEPLPIPPPQAPEPVPLEPQALEPVPLAPEALEPVPLAPEALEPVPLPSARPPSAAKPPSRQPPLPKAPAFPAPMDFSFGKPLSAPNSAARPRPAPHIPGTIDMSLGPASKGIMDPTPLSERDQAIAGADWRNALSKWVSEHAYYPEQARRDAEEGDAKVHVIADPNGRVRGVELIGKSGSTWLDLALQALFRDQRIPPLPPGDKEPIEFNFTMHYVLIRRR